MLIPKKNNIRIEKKDTHGELISIFLKEIMWIIHVMFNFLYDSSRWPDTDDFTRIFISNLQSHRQIGLGLGILSNSN